ncbi:hypothetical protein AB0G79_20450 [Streptomyces sp. NPDC020807]|uniref:hypothetical protein n=1 Tax=Streptomyces sp. NPDC020807 TaxID=3155119 RepID=UPI0033CB2EB2
MTTTRQLATVDELRARFVGAGAGVLLAELPTTGGEPSGIDAEQCEAERDGLVALLTARWGPPRELDLWPVVERTVAGEALSVPESWLTVAGHCPEPLLWWDGARWIGLGLARWGEEAPPRLLALVTTADPPQAQDTAKSTY